MALPLLLDVQNAGLLKVVKPVISLSPLFNKAKVIIGPHGAAFSNLIFSKKELKLFEIIPSDHLSLKCKRFSNILGFEYNRFNLERIDQVGGDMFLDKKTLTKILNLF